MKHPSGILKCRFDLIDLEDDVITDVKSTQDASMTGFFDQAAKFHYGVQQEFYRMVAEMAWGHKFTFAFLAIEMSEPFDFAIRTMPEICTPVWTAQITDAMQRIAQCIEQDQWPGYTHENAFCPVGLRKNSVPLRH